ncbi:DUF2911 domain-containing protein [Ascidiimonas sp. W6]|uniref:DUF2911 domain-containing protein n=1 Tax=Ascidiimonas meishanensis TaxID=3128903 RepID=UPI0030EE33F3
MKKLGIIFLIVLGIVVTAYFFVGPIMRKITKKHSPETTIYYQENGHDLSLYYNQPSMKGRKIFGNLIPYGKVWRTGANEATAFNTSKDINVAGKPLPSGTYTLWTIPEKENWTVIFNSKSYDWGVALKGTKIEPSREPEFDVLAITVPVIEQAKATERFTFAFENTDELMLTMIWENTKLEIPIK